MTDPDSALRAGQIALPANVTLLTDPEEMVVRIESARVEEPVPVSEDAAETPEGQDDSDGEDNP